MKTYLKNQELKDHFVWVEDRFREAFPVAKIDIELKDFGNELVLGIRFPPPIDRTWGYWLQHWDAETNEMGGLDDFPDQEQKIRDMITGLQLTLLG